MGGLSKKLLHNKFVDWGGEASICSVHYKKNFGAIKNVPFIVDAFFWQKKVECPLHVPISYSDTRSKVEIFCSFFEPLQREGKLLEGSSSKSHQGVLRAAVMWSFSVSSVEIYDSCLVKENGRLLKDCSEEVVSKLWSKAMVFLLMQLRSWRLWMGSLYPIRLILLEFPYECYILLFEGCGCPIKRKWFSQLIRKETFDSFLI